jgi:N-acetylglucosaminyl-diphospho-decaprenol L-rhamnosyltransferase
VEADPVRAYGGETAVVTVTRTGRPEPAPLLGSLAAATTRPVRVVVADTAAAAAVPVPGGVEVVRLVEDVGRAAAVNRAVAALPETVGWVVVAEPGACWGPGSLDVLLDTAVRHPRAGLVGPRLLGRAGAVASGGALPTVPEAARGRVQVEVPGPGTVGWVSTAAVLVRRGAWDSVDGLDPRYQGGPGDMGDVDLADRLTRAGWLVVHEPAAGVVVEGGGTAPDGHGILESHADGLRRYVHDRGRAPARALLALTGRLRRG